MIQWHKSPSSNSFTFVQDQAFIIPIDSGGCQIHYNGEYCTLKEFTVMEVINKLKESTADSPVTDFKTLLENILKEN